MLGSLAEDGEFVESQGEKKDGRSREVEGSSRVRTACGECGHRRRCDKFSGVFYCRRCQDAYYTTSKKISITSEGEKEEDKESNSARRRKRGGRAERRKRDKREEAEKRDGVKKSSKWTDEEWADWGAENKRERRERRKEEGVGKKERKSSKSRESKSGTSKREIDEEAGTKTGSSKCAECGWKHKLEEDAKNPGDFYCRPCWNRFRRANR